MKISDTKKLAAITAAFFITVTAFSGCSESASSSQTTNSVSQSAKSDIDASIAAEDIDVGYDEESSIGITFADGSAAIDGEVLHTGHKRRCSTGFRSTPAKR